MSARAWIAAVAALSVSITAASAGSKKHRHHHRLRPAAVDIVPPYRGSQDNGPAHFVRLPNGLIVSSHQCFTDEGYGRYLPCGAGQKF